MKAKIIFGKLVYLFIGKHMPVSDSKISFKSKNVF